VDQAAAVHKDGYQADPPAGEARSASTRREDAHRTGDAGPVSSADTKRHHGGWIAPWEDGGRNPSPRIAVEAKDRSSPVERDGGSVPAGHDTAGPLTENSISCAAVRGRAPQAATARRRCLARMKRGEAGPATSESERRVAGSAEARARAVEAGSDPDSDPAPGAATRTGPRTFGRQLEAPGAARTRPRAAARTVSVIKKQPGERHDEGPEAAAGRRGPRGIRGRKCNEKQTERRNAGGAGERADGGLRSRLRAVDVECLRRGLRQRHRWRVPATDARPRSSGGNAGACREHGDHHSRLQPPGRQAHRAAADVGREAIRRVRSAVITATGVDPRTRST